MDPVSFALGTNTFVDMFYASGTQVPLIDDLDGSVSAREMIERMLREHGAMHRGTLVCAVQRSLAASGQRRVSPSTLNGAVSRWPWRFDDPTRTSTTVHYVYFHRDSLYTNNE